jgi:C-terminal processing protease CtpA/Prc
LLAVLEWFTPKGRQIWHKGITPDVEVSLPVDVEILLPYQERDLTSEELKRSPDAQLLKAIQVLQRDLAKP